MTKVSFADFLRQMADNNESPKSDEPSLLPEAIASPLSTGARVGRLGKETEMSDWTYFAGFGRWAGSNSKYRYGPYGSREEAIAGAIKSATEDAINGDDGAWWLAENFDDGVPRLSTVAAQRAPMTLKLSDWLDVESVIVSAEDASYQSLGSTYGISLDVDCSEDQRADLERRLKQACDEWQDDNGLIFTRMAFSATRDRKDVVVSPPTAEEIFSIAKAMDERASDA